MREAYPPSAVCGMVAALMLCGALLLNVTYSLNENENEEQQRLVVPAPTKEEVLERNVRHADHEDHKHYHVVEAKTNDSIVTTFVASSTAPVTNTNTTYITTSAPFTTTG
jgi:hypothetical protein